MRFVYQAVRPDGGSERGTVEASTLGEARGVLLAKRWIPTRVTTARGRRGLRRGPSSREIAVFMRGLSSLVQADVPLVKAVAASGHLSQRLAPAVEIVAASLREGRGLSEGMRSTGMFPDLVLGIIASAERGGQLAAGLERAAVQLEREAETASRLTQALAYPTLLLVVGLGAVGVIVFAVIPRFAAVLADLQQELPPITRMLLQVGNLAQQYGPFVVPGMLLLGAGAWGYGRTPKGRARSDAILLALPGIGPVRHFLGSARLSHGLGELLRAGTPLLQALDTTASTLTDRTLVQRLQNARKRVNAGDRLAAAFAAEQVYPPVLLTMVEAGEEAGRIAPMLLRAGDLAAGEGDRRLRALIGLIEPVLILGFGFLVALVAMALLQGIYGIRV